MRHALMILSLLALVACGDSGSSDDDVQPDVVLDVGPLSFDAVDISGVWGEMIAIPSGKSWIGCDHQAFPGECPDSERPFHEVWFSAYEIDRTEVTRAAYGACVEAGACSAPGGALDLSLDTELPVTYVSWEQAATFCAWAGRRLCCEVEWERGARGGCETVEPQIECFRQITTYPWGWAGPTCDTAVFAEDELSPGCGENGPAAVCTASGESDYGLCDMAGNAAEWVADDWHESYAEAPDDELPWVDEPRSGLRVSKGGGWNDEADAIRSNARLGLPPDATGAGAAQGFRCCR